MFSSGGIGESWLYARGKAVIRPFAEVALELHSRVSATPPHTEDYAVDSTVLPLSRRLLSADARSALLTELDDGSVGRFVGATVHQDHDYYAKSGEGCRSLGTIRPVDIH